MSVIFTLPLVALLLWGAAVVPPQNGAGQQATPPGGRVSPAEEAEAARLNSAVVKLFGQGRYDEALPLARRALEIREKALGGSHPAVASALYNLGAIYAGKRDYGEAERHYKRALAVAEGNGAAQAQLAGELNTQLGLLNFGRGDYKEAEGYYLRSLSLKEQARGAEHPALVPALLNLVEVHLVRREFDRAEEYLGRVVSILTAHPPAKKDLATADRIQGYLCPLLGAKEVSLAKKAQDAIYRLQEPEKAAARDKARAESSDKAPASGGVLNGRVVKSVAPDYPLAAKAQRLSGTVVVGLTVSEEGKVLEAEALCGHPVLTEAAVDAVRRWRFSPTLLEGRPVKVTGTVTVNFVLQ